MGAKNSQATAIELSAVTNGNLDTAIENVRKGEQQLTANFKSLNRQLRKAFASSLGRKFTFTHSGDDVGIIFTGTPWNKNFERTTYRGATSPEESGKVLHAVSQTQKFLDYRIVFLGDDLWDASGGLMIGHGENLLKEVSESLENRLLKFFQNEKDLQSYLKNTMITAQMKGTTAGYGDIQIMIYSQSDKVVDAQFLNEIANQTSVSIKNLNAEIKASENRVSQYTKHPMIYYFQPGQQTAYNSTEKTLIQSHPSYSNPSRYPIPQ
jgi:chaperonin cofactor prefoldin